MKVEFTGRFTDTRKKSEEEQYLDYTKSLINPDFTAEKEVRYTYDPITLEISDVRSWIRLDRAHTQLNMEKGNVYIIKLPYLYFSAMYTEMTGETISVVEYTQGNNNSVPYQDGTPETSFGEIGVDNEE